MAICSSALEQIWNISTDQLKINFTKILAEINPDVVTKRIIISTKRNEVFQSVRTYFPYFSDIKVALQLM